LNNIRTYNNTYTRIPIPSYIKSSYTSQFSVIDQTENHPNKISTIERPSEASAAEHGCEVTRLRVTNLCCVGEERLIRTTLAKLHGIEDVKVNVIGRYAVVKHCPNPCCSPSFLIVERLNEVKLGASVQEVGSSSSDDVDESPDTKKLLMTLFTFFLFIVGVSFEGGESDLMSKSVRQHISLSLLIICIVVAGVPVVYSVYVAFLRRIIDINVLIFVAVCGAVAILEFIDSALVLTLFAIAQCIVAEVMRWVRNTVRVSKGNVPTTAILPSGAAVPLQSLNIGDVVVFRAGDMVSVDGKVVRGSAVIDESAMTGEAVPRSKDAESKSLVLSGTVVQNGYIEVELLERPENSSIQKLHDLIADAQVLSLAMQIIFVKYIFDVFVSFLLGRERQSFEFGGRICSVLDTVGHSRSRFDAFTRRRAYRCLA